MDTSFSPLFETGGGFRGTESSLFEKFVDTLEAWLIDVSNAPRKSSRPSGHFDKVALAQSVRIQYLRVLQGLWHQSRFEGYRIGFDDRSGHRTWTPGDLQTATVLEAGVIRCMKNFDGQAMLAFNGWAAVSPDARQKMLAERKIVSVTRLPEGWLRIETELTSALSPVPDSNCLEQMALERSHVGHFLDWEMTMPTGITVRLLVKAWGVLAELATALVEPTPLKSMTFSRAENLACVLQPEALVAALTTCLSIDVEVATSIVDFFTLAPRVPSNSNGHRGLWSAPIVTVPGEQRVGLCLAALAKSNPLRKVESWLEKGGINDQHPTRKRGDVYESLVRTRIEKALSANEVLRNECSAPASIKKSNVFGQQVDLLFRLGSLLVVGEIKFFLFPADIYERKQYFDKLRKAVVQLKRAIQAIGKNPTLAAAALGMSVHELQALTLVPIIITNQGFALSLSIDGCRVVDETTLVNYLVDPRIRSELRSYRGSDRQETFHVQYVTAGDASDNFRSMIAMPPMLDRFVDRLKWVYQALCMPGDDDLVLIQSPWLMEIGSDGEARPDQATL